MAKGKATLKVTFSNAKAIIQRLKAELAQLQRATRK